MVFIKNSEKLSIFLKKYNEKFAETISSKEISAKHLALSSLKQWTAEWNAKYPSEPYFLHEMLAFEDIVFTLEHKEFERELEFNTEEWKIQKEKLKAHQQEREYQRMISRNTSKKSQMFGLLSPGESVKDFEKSLSFGVSFIFSLFLSGLSGYYFGIYILGFSTNKSLILAAIATIATIIMETMLFMIKIGKTTGKTTDKKTF